MGAALAKAQSASAEEYDETKTLEFIAEIVRSRMGPALIATVSNAHGRSELQHSIGKAIDNAIKWHGPKG